MDANTIHMYASILNLGMSVGGNHKRSRFWDAIIDKIKKTLAGWKGRHLSFVKRILKLVITSLPLFYMSFFKMYTIVISTFKKKVCKTKEEIGLGILYIRLFNITIIEKWIWRLRTQKERFWKAILVSNLGWKELRNIGINNDKSIWWSGGRCLEHKIH